jgi:hypothetical protein
MLKLPLQHLQLPYICCIWFHLIHHPKTLLFLLITAFSSQKHLEQLHLVHNDFQALGGTRDLEHWVLLTYHATAVCCCLFIAPDLSAWILPALTVMCLLALQTPPAEHVLLVHQVTATAHILAAA